MPKPRPRPQPIITEDRADQIRVGLVRTRQQNRDRARRAARIVRFSAAVSGIVLLLLGVAALIRASAALDAARNGQVDANFAKAEAFIEVLVGIALLVMSVFVWGSRVIVAAAVDLLADMHEAQTR